LTLSKEINALLLGLLQLIELFGQFIGRVLLLLAGGSQSSLALGVGLFQVTTQLLQLSFALLVDLDLRDEERDNSLNFVLMRDDLILYTVYFVMTAN
jgi:hypothetical protein